MKAAIQADVSVESCQKLRDASGVDLFENVVALVHHSTPCALVAIVCRWRLYTLAQTGSSNGCGHRVMALV